MTALEDERLLHDSVIMRYLVYEPSHMHLLSIDADWELEGHAICRVLDSRCNGQVYRAMSYLSSWNSILSGKANHRHSGVDIE